MDNLAGDTIVTADLVVDQEPIGAAEHLLVEEEEDPAASEQLQGGEGRAMSCSPCKDIGNKASDSTESAR